MPQPGEEAALFQPARVSGPVHEYILVFLAEGVCLGRRVGFILYKSRYNLWWPLPSEKAASSQSSGSKTDTVRTFPMGRLYSGRINGCGQSEATRAEIKYSSRK